jgi:hypothetical protein
MAIKNTVFLDGMPCGSLKNRRFGGMYHHHHLGGETRRVRSNVISN